MVTKAKNLLFNTVWFATETQHYLPCHGIGSAIIWYLNGTAVNDSSLFQILPRGTLRVTEITLDLDNSVFHCEGPNGAIISEYHVHVEGALHCCILLLLSFYL